MPLQKQHYTETLQFYSKNSDCLFDHIWYCRNLDVVKQMIFILQKARLFGKKLWSFLMTDVPFCEIFSLIWLPKSSFWSRCKPKCFWETLRSTGTSLKKTWGLKGFPVFRENITSWASLVISGLNIIFHWYAHFEIFFKSLLIYSGETLLFTTKEIDALSTKSFTSVIKLLGRSFMYTKNGNEPEVDHCSMPVLTSS